MAQSDSLGLLRVPIAGILAWIVPGLGHIFLGHRGRGLVFLVTITATFWNLRFSPTAGEEISGYRARQKKGAAAGS